MMLQPLQQAFRPASSGASLPAPIGGWNARDPIAKMASTDAIALDNFFPRPGDVMLRKGSSVFATLPADAPGGTLNNIRSILGYNLPTGQTKLFAATETGIYDASIGGTVSVVASAATYNVWESVNISTAGGNFLWCCNGVDKARYFNGTAWTVLDGASTPALTGITSTDITHVNLFKARLYLCKKASLSFYYLPVNSVAGAAAEYPLGAVCRRGGYLVATGTWTLDGGAGPEDYFVAITSEGEVVIYAGTDPANAATWGLQGVYNIAPPLSKRCLLKFGGDLLYLTTQGIFPLSKALQTTDVRVAVSDKISNAWVEYAQAYRTLFGWQMEYAPDLSMLLVNVPIAFNADTNQIDSYQFVMNTQTGAWCRFIGMSAETWAFIGGRLYFAANNKLFVAWEGGDDPKAAPIAGAVRTAFLYPAGRGSLAKVALLRPIFSSNGNSINFQLGVDHDYSSQELFSNQITYLQEGAFWDRSNWDEAFWQDTDFTNTELISAWRSVSHYPGRALALRLRLLSKGVSMVWTATDFIIQKGGMM